MKILFIQFSRFSFRFPYLTSKYSSQTSSKYILWFSGPWFHVVLEIISNVSEELTASILKVEYYVVSEPNLHRRKDLRSRPHCALFSFRSVVSHSL